MYLMILIQFEFNMEDDDDDRINLAELTMLRNRNSSF
jgi:hypothetical protein